MGKVGFIFVIWESGDEEMEEGSGEGEDMEERGGSVVNNATAMVHSDSME